MREDYNQQIPEAALSPTEDVHTEAERRNGWKQYAVVAGLAAVTLAGCSSPEVSNKTEHHETAPTTIVEMVPAGVTADIEKAMIVDKCDTQVTAKEVITTYQRLFLTHEAPNQTLQQLTTRSENLITDIEKMRKEQGFVPLPDNFDTLSQDADGARQLPLSTYNKAATAFFDKFGVKTYIDWPDQSNSLDFPSTEKDVTLDRVAPVTDENPLIRKAIVNSMNSFANLPPKLVKQAELQSIVFGDIKASSTSDSDGRLGESSPGHHAIIIDVNNETNNAEAGSPIDEYYKKAPNHEFTHRVNYQVCGPLLAGSGFLKGTDPAYESLNRGLYEYTEETMNTMAADESGDSKYRALDHEGSGEVVATQAYSGLSIAEDKATAFGETFLDTSFIEDLISKPANNMEILNEKLALLMSRVNKEDPGILPYYAKLFDAVRLEKTIYELRLKTVGDKGKYIDEVTATGGPIDGAKVMKIVAAQEPYDKLQSRLQAAVDGSPVER